MENKVNVAGEERRSEFEECVDCAEMAACDKNHSNFLDTRGHIFNSCSFEANVIEEI